MDHAFIQMYYKLLAFGKNLITKIRVNSVEPNRKRDELFLRGTTMHRMGLQVALLRLNTPVTPEARCHYVFWSKPPSPK